jgi:hypothetical protein
MRSRRNNMKFLRHIGKVGDRKVAVIFREIPGEDHMCLLVHTELLNSHIHDPLMQCIESDIGQNSENLGDALNRSFTKDGKIILQVLHKEGLLKKMQSSQVLMTPTPTTTIRLDELNKILTEMKQGEEAVKRLAELDRAAGMGQPPSTYAKQLYEAGARRVTERPQTQSQPAQSVQAGVNGALDDAALANNLRAQAERMTREANGLMAEASRLLQEAATIAPTESVTPATTPEPVTKKRGRPAKAKVTA